VRVWREHNRREGRERSGEFEWVGKRERDVYKKERNVGIYRVSVTV